MMKKTLIEVKDVTKVFGTEKRENVLAIKDLSFDVHKGEFLSIVGPSGCGKSTLLRLITGLDTPTKGKIIVDGKEVTAPRVDVAMVFQDPTLMRWRTVMDNILLPIEFMREDKKKYRERATSLIKLVGLQGFEDFYPEELSGGMRSQSKRLQGLIHDPSTLLMDEPFGPLDALTRLTLDFELMRIWHETKKTILFVTHDVREGVFLGDRVLVLSSRPCCLKAMKEVDIPRPRTEESEGTKKFIKLEREILGDLGVRKVA